ncbi:anti-sigma factor [Actinokineospora xionganensis]|uniref:Regulator of SigK n=1 Tax=Actinokineospora xionganensis TaxID=2684470 RepID=A0ABR7L3S7_9PSEU|nr:anti-sigma factor [Actinokineospora xionganensis]MBC6447344.1 anti-sigma factor [Actinokineospora xionganensis]
MPRRRVNPEIHSLTGAYALDALTTRERAEFDEHLRRCDACAVEIAELSETAGRLATAASALPPADLKHRVVPMIRHERQLPPLVPPLVPSTEPVRRDQWRWAATLAVAASVVAATAMGAQAMATHHELERTRQASQARVHAISRVLTAPDVRLSMGHGATAALSRELDSVVVLARGMPEPPSDRVYQAWLIGPDGPRSAGLVQTGPDAAPVLAAASGATQVGITVEPPGGSPRPTTSAVALLTLPA